MRIQGSYKEFNFLINLALRLKSEFMFLAPEGEMWLLYDGGKTLFLRSHLEVSHHTVLSWESLSNLQLTMNRAGKQLLLGKGRPAGLRQEFFCMEPDFLQVGRFEKGKIKINTHMEKARMYSQFVRKFEGLNFLPELPGTPQLKLETKLIRQYVTDVKRDYNKVNRNSVFGQRIRPGADESQNIFQIDHDENLMIIRKEKDVALADKQVRTYPAHFFIREKFQEYTFYLSDSDINMMLLMDEHETIDEFRVLLYKDLYVIDVYGPELRFKIWHERNKSVNSAIMLQE